MRNTGILLSSPFFYFSQRLWRAHRWNSNIPQHLLKAFRVCVCSHCRVSVTNRPLKRCWGISVFCSQPSFKGLSSHSMESLWGLLHKEALKKTLRNIGIPLASPLWGILVFHCHLRVIVWNLHRLWGLLHKSFKKTLRNIGIPLSSLFCLLARYNDSKGP